jgi:peptidoglycan/LPS O-acetylase OafA/YrhL
MTSLNMTGSSNCSRPAAKELVAKGYAWLVGWIFESPSRVFAMRPSFSANLDLLRATAVLLVLAQHLLNRFGAGRWFGGSVPPIGTFGVLLFFVHTCLVLMYSMQRSQLNGLPLLENFYTRRLFRIYPLSVLAVLTAVALHLDSGVNGVPGLSHAPPVTQGRIVSNLLLVQNLAAPGSIINVLWSLPYELQMYIFLPFLFVWLRPALSKSKRSSVAWLCVLWTAAAVLAVVRSALAESGQMSSLVGRLSLLEFVPNFLPGVISYILIAHGLAHVTRIKSYVWPPFILLLVAVYSIRPGSAVGWVLSLLLGFGIPYFGEIQTEWLRTVSHKIATYSYGIYLSHPFCIWFVADRLGSFPLSSRILVLIVLLVGIPAALYHAIEKPMIKVGANLAERWTDRRTPTAEAA